MVNILGTIIVTLVIIGVGGGGAYILWLITRPKKLTWKAKIYQLGEGIKPPIRDKKGNILSDIKLSDLKPFAKDIVERIEKDPGITVYRLIKLNKIVPAVTSDVVEYWGSKDKEVSILCENDSYTILKKGYDRSAGAIFRPMQSDRINMIKSEMAIRKDRLHKEKDILQAITPWIVTGICMLGLVGICYISVDGYLTMQEKMTAGQIEISKNLESISQRCVCSEAPKPQPDKVPPAPPSVE